MRSRAARLLLCLAGLSLVLTTLVAIPAMRSAEAQTVSIQQTVTGNVFVEGETPAFRVETSNSQFSWAARDYWGNQVGNGSAQVPDGQVRLEVPLQKTGYYKLRVTVGTGEQARDVQTTFAILPKPTTPSDDGFVFGMQTHFSHGWSTNIVPLLRRIGVESVRDQQTWGDIETAPGEYDFSVRNGRYQNYMDALDQTNIEVLAQFGLSNDNYDDGATPHSNEGRQAYARFVQEVLAHYGNQIQEVAVYNEPNLPKFGDHGDGPADATPENYHALLEETYRAVKEVRPDVEVGGPEMAAAFSNQGKWNPWLEEFLGLGGLASLDSMSIHPYRDRCCGPEGLAQDLRRLREVMSEYDGGAGKPLWITEQGWTTALLSERKQAQYMLRTYVLGMKEVDRFHWYNFMDHKKSYGLIRNRGSALGQYTPKPSYVTFGVMTDQLAGLEYQGTDDTPVGVQSNRFGGNGTTRVMWAPEQHRTVSLRASGPVQVTDMMGVTRTLHPVRGEVTLTLTGDPVYVRGPVDEIQAGGGFAIDGEQSAVSDSIPATLTLDNAGATAQTATFTVGGKDYDLTASAGGTEQRSISVASGGGAGRRVIQAKVSVDGELTGLVTKYVRLRDDVKVRMLPDVPDPAVNGRAAGMLIEVTNNRRAAGYQVNEVDWKVAGAADSKQVDVTVPAGGTKLIPVSLSDKNYWEQYSATATAHFDSEAPIRRTGEIGFNPLFQQTLTVDGKLDELADTPRMRLNEDGEVQRTDAGIPYGGPNDLGGPMWFAADERYLYVAAKVSDNVHFNDQTGRGIKNGDSVYLGLARGLPGDTKDFYQYVVALTPDGPKVRRQLAPPSEDTGPADNVDVSVRRDDKNRVTRYEIAIPWDDLRQIDVADNVLALTALAMDNDGTDAVDREGWIEWGSGIGAGKDPSEFRPMTIAGRAIAGGLITDR